MSFQHRFLIPPLWRQTQEIRDEYSTYLCLGFYFILNRTFLPHLAMLSVALFYSINFFTVKVLFLEMNPFTALALRSISGLLFFGIAWKWFVNSEKINRKDIPLLIACGISGIAVNQIFFLWGLSLTSEFHGAILMLLTPIFVFILNHYLRGEDKWNIRKIAGLTLSTTGAIWLVKEASVGGIAGRESLEGDIMILINAASYGLYLVLVKPLTAQYKPVTILFFMFLSGGIINLLTGLPFLIETDFSLLSPQAWFGLIFLIVGATILAYLLNAWAMVRVSSVWVGTYIYLQPLLTMLISAVALSGSITPVRILYALMILSGVYLTGKR
jgi:drug/metabolite transporter (DMT)-like permease